MDNIKDKISQLSDKKKLILIKRYKDELRSITMSFMKKEKNNEDFIKEFNKTSWILKELGYDIDKDFENKNEEDNSDELLTFNI